MENRSSRGIITATTLAGAALGYLVLHPYTVVIYSLYGPGDQMRGEFDVAYVVKEAVSAFRMGHIQMGIPYALIGAAGGMFMGLWLVELRRMKNSELRNCALDTSRAMMVTLSHYLLNAVAIIGGFAWRIQKAANDEESLKHAVIIRKEAEHIEAVVKSLQALQEVEEERYTKNGEAMMIDLTDEIKKRMKDQEAHDMGGDMPAREGELK